MKPLLTAELARSPLTSPWSRALKSPEPVQTWGVLTQALVVQFLSSRLGQRYLKPDAWWWWWGGGTSQTCSDDMSEFVFSCPPGFPFRSLSPFAIPFLLSVVVMHKKTGPKSHSVSPQWLLLQRAITLPWQYQREQWSQRASSPSPCTTCRKLPHTSAGRRWSGSDTHACVTFLGGSGLWCHAETLPGER